MPLDPALNAEVKALVAALQDGLPCLSARTVRMG
jgi:hypothetical protein